MSLSKSLVKNTLALSIPNMLNPVVSFVLVLVISRYMGVEGLGEYSLVLSYVAVFAVIASLGLGDLIVRETAREPQDVLVFLSNAAMFGAISSVAAIVGMNVFVAAMGYSAEVFTACLIMSFSLVASTVTTYLEAVFRSMEKAEYVAFTFLVENVIRVALCVVLVLHGYGIVTLFAVILATRVFGAALLFGLFVKVHGMPGWQVRPEIWRSLVRHAPTFASIAIFATIHLSIDTIMLSKLKSIESVGVYSAADRLLDITKMLPIAFAAALLPFFTKEFSGGVERLRGLASDSLRYVLLGALPLVVGTVIIADQIITFIYGEKFLASIPVLRLHIVSLIPFSMAYILAQVLIATDNQKVDLTINIIAAGINIVLNYLLIPHFAEMGAVAATLVTIIIFHQLQYRYIRRHLFSVAFMEPASKAVAAAALMGAVTYALRDLNLFLNIGISGLTYLLLVYLLKALSPDEIVFLKSLVRRGSPTETP